MAKSQNKCILCGNEEFGELKGKLKVPRCCADCSLECEQYILTRLRGLALTVLRPCGIKLCKTCGKEFTAHHGMQSYCNPQCQRKAQAKRFKQASQRTINCVICKTEFTTGYISKNTCSAQCAQKYRHIYNMAWRKRRRAEGKEAYYKHKH